MDEDNLKWAWFYYFYLLKQFLENFSSKTPIDVGNDIFWDANDSLMHRDGLKNKVSLADVAGKYGEGNAASIKGDISPLI